MAEMTLEELKVGLEEEAHRVGEAMEKIKAAFPEPGDPVASDSAILALGVMWYTFLATIRLGRGDGAAEETELESRLLASIMHPHLVSQKDAFERAQRHNALLNPQTKA